MPLYVFKCPCGSEEDRMCSYEDARSQACECGQPMVKLITGAKLVGPTDTKPASFGGKTFVKQSDVARWENSDASKGLKVLSPKDREVKAKIHAGKQKSELRAQAAGYRSERHRQEEVKKEGRSKGVM